ncbi:MAG: hypothetical protein PVH84_04670 [Candidatus Aminicenantes bacterium]|jgi:hypothetical protein
MKTIRILPLVMTILILVKPMVSLKSSSCGDKGLKDLIPIEIVDWVRYLDLLEYEGEDLFFYIDGGAEIYHEYGFERVVVQDFQNTNGKSVTLEIYKMASTESAYGIYTFKSSGKGQALNLGHDCKLQDYYLNFWKDRYLVTITGFDAEKETIEGIRSIASAVDTKIRAPGNAVRPGLYERLPLEGLDTQSIKYFKGNLGLVNSYPFANTDIFDIQKGIKGSYSGGYDIYILEYKDAATCREAFDSAKEDFKTETKYQNKVMNEDRIDLEDSSGTQIVIRPTDRFILIVLGARSSAQVDEILVSLAKQLN